MLAPQMPLGALLVLRGTRAMQMGLGLGVIGVVYFVLVWLRGTLPRFRLDAANARMV